jgi:hypothetical protein
MPESVEAHLEQIRSDLLAAAEQIDLGARAYEEHPIGASARDAYVGRWRWFEDVAVPRFETEIRAEERNRLLNPSDELVEAVTQAIRDAEDHDITEEGASCETLARAALQAAGSALDSDSAG